MSDRSRSEKEQARAVAEVARRAIRRLDILEWLIYAGAAGLAILGGAGVAWLLSQAGGADFRATWIVGSLVIFVVAGLIAVVKNRKDERAWLRDREQAGEEKHG